MTTSTESGRVVEEVRTLLDAQGDPEALRRLDQTAIPAGHRARAPSRCAARSLPGIGEGTVDGPGLSGGIRWDLNEIVGEEACQMFFAGIVETDDGASITFDTVGFGQVSNPAADPSRWVVTAVARFESHDPRYSWITAQPASWIGEFDMETYEHRYRIVLPKAGNEARSEHRK